MNTAEQKAEELIEKFRPYCQIDLLSIPLSRKTFAVECALICVEEILNTITPKPDNWSINVYWLNDRFYNQQEYLNFWNEVKQYLQTQK